MKDIRIKWKWIKREFFILLMLYFVANLFNLASILIYQTPFSELYSSQGYVLFLTEWFYILSVIIRLLYFGIKYLLKKK